MLSRVILLLAIFLTCYDPVAGIYIKKDKDDSTFGSSECPAITCEAAKAQAKGLSKLALLDEFVSQTIMLLNDLMKNMDNELEKTASTLLNHVHPQCGSTVEILEEVIQKQKNKNAQFSQESTNLSNGIGPLSGHSGEETDEFQGRNINENHHGQLEDTQHQGGNFHTWGNEYEENHNEDNEDDSGFDGKLIEQQSNQGNNLEDRDTAFSHYNKKWSKKESQSGSSHAWSGSNRGKYDQESREDTDKSISFGSNNYGSGGGKYEQESAENTQESNNLGSRKYDSKNQYTNSNSYGKKINAQHIDQKLSLSTKKVCSGVGKGSVYWVPGLDDWCEENCANGYCPKTHCIC